MLIEFNDFLSTKCQFKNNQSILIACSGGVDSMVLARLCKEANIKFALAHCNFKLRGAASDEDALLVKSFAKHYQVDYFEQSFDTELIAKKNKESIQITARNLRYDWLENIRKEKGFDYLATAHHSNDNIETVLYKFAKGTGIRGLYGILPKRDTLIRPLLFASKNNIIAYARQRTISYREDASNASDKYRRNFIRQHIVPKFEEINPAFVESAGQGIEHIRETAMLFDFFINKIRKEVVEQKDAYLQIDKNKIAQYPAINTVLFELLKPYGFHSDQVKQLIEARDNVGAQFQSESYTLLVDRDKFLLKNKESLLNHELFLQNEHSSLQINEVQQLTAEILEGVPNRFPINNNMAFLDLEKLTFPLKLRKWKDGDFFRPLGMNGQKQKLQDFFSNNKLNRFEKEQVWILESAGQICWIIGHRIDERFKITPQTDQVVSLYYSE